MRRSPLLLALLPLVSACGTSAAAGNGSDDAATPDVQLTPLSEFYGYNGDEEALQAEWDNLERERQDLIVTCMAEQGFEYIPQDPSAWVSIDPAELGEPEWNTREYAERYGFGVSTQMFEQSVVGPDLIGQNEAYNDATIWEDPNQDYIDALAPDVQSAYFEALYGNDPGVEWDDTLSEEENQARVDDYYENVYTPSGCDAESQEETYADDPSTAFYQAFGDELDDLYQRVEADPELVEFRNERDRCVSEAGYDIDVENPWNEFSERTNEIYNHVTWPNEELTEADWAEMSDEQMEAANEMKPTLSDEGRAMLAEVQADEIAAALAVFDCGGSELWDVYTRVQIRLEQEFVDTHAAELEAFRP